MYTIVPVAFLSLLFCWNIPETADAISEMEAKGTDHRPSQWQRSQSFKDSLGPAVPGHRERIQKCPRLEIVYWCHGHFGLLEAHAIVSQQNHEEDRELEEDVTQRWSIRKLIPGWGRPPPDQDPSSSSWRLLTSHRAPEPETHDFMHRYCPCPRPNPSCPQSLSFHIWLVNGGSIQYISEW